MIKRILIFAALAAALLGVTPTSAESVCANAGATGLVSDRLVRSGGIQAPTVCVPVP